MCAVLNNAERTIEMMEQLRTHVCIEAERGEEAEEGEAAEAGALPALAAVLHLRPTRFDASATGLTERVGILNPRF